MRWGFFSVYGVKLAKVRLVGELLAEAGLPSEDLARKLLGNLAYRSADLQDELAEAGVLLTT